MAKVNEKFIVNLQGKDFVTYEGLLDTAHQMGLNGISTEIVQIPSKDNGNRCIMKATARTKEGAEYTGYGDADPTNVNSMIGKHMIRMAETRSKARALRDLTNIGMTAIEELGGDDETPKATPKQPKTQQQSNNNGLSRNEKIDEVYRLGLEIGLEKADIDKRMKDDYNKTEVKFLNNNQLEEAYQRILKAASNK